MGLGFIHGVMNTDNTAISGETIDYGPCAFMDAYHPDTVFSSIDQLRALCLSDHQPDIAVWNLAQFATCLLPLMDDDRTAAIERATEAVHGFAPRFQEAWRAGVPRQAGSRDRRRGATQHWRIGFLTRWRRDRRISRSPSAGLADGTAALAFADATPLAAWHDELDPAPRPRGCDTRRTGRGAQGGKPRDPPAEPPDRGSDRGRGRGRLRPVRAAPRRRLPSLRGDPPRPRSSASPPRRARKCSRPSAGPEATRPRRTRIPLPSRGVRR